MGAGMPSLSKGRYAVRLAETAGDLRRAQQLRWLAFIGQRGGVAEAGADVDADALDDECRHVLVEDTRSGTLVCTFRFLHLQGGDQIDRSYSAQYYNLARLRGFAGPMVEMGRFCIHPEWRDPNILRMAWAFMTAYVDANGVELLFGCSSFTGTEPAAYEDAFAMLKDRHLAPRRWLPRVKAPRVFRFARLLKTRQPDARRAMAGMPPLLRTYLMMGGWVSDHAVIDPHLNTLHVFTGLEIKSIPPARARLLRAVAG